MGHYFNRTSSRRRSHFPLCDYTVTMTDNIMQPKGVAYADRIPDREYIVSGVVNKDSEGFTIDSFEWKCPSLPGVQFTEHQLEQLKTKAGQDAIYDELDVDDEPDFYGED